MFIKYRNSWIIKCPWFSVNFVNSGLLAPDLKPEIVSVVGTIMSPPTQGVYILIPGSCEYITLLGKRNFTYLINWGSWDGEIILVGPM